MHMRLLTMEVDGDGVDLLTRRYEERIITALGSMDGCLYAGLARSVKRPGRCLSLTLWDTQAHAATYEHSGLFGELLRETEIFLSPSVEYTIRLSEDLKVEYVPVPTEPVASSYPIAAQSGPGRGEGSLSRAGCLRIVSLKILPEKTSEFKELYVSRSIPALRAAPGCRYVYLLESDDKPDEFFSITVWESREQADAYERSGVFDTLIEEQKHTFSGHAQGMLLSGGDETARSRGTGDPMAEHFTILVGKSFGSAL